MEYRVKALSVLGLYNKVYESGDIVTDAAFPVGNAKILVERGFLEPIVNKTIETKSKKEKVVKKQIK